MASPRILYAQSLPDCRWPIPVPTLSFPVNPRRARAITQGRRLTTRHWGTAVINQRKV